MAKKARARKPVEPEVEESTGTELANWEAQMAMEATEAAKLERPSIVSVSFRAGIITIGGASVPDNKLPCIVVANTFENRYYSTPWDPEVIESPDCFALSEDGMGMVPHANVEEPQHPTCDGCPMAEWKSDPSGRGGKACKEIRKLILLPMSPGMVPEEIPKVEMAVVKLPVTSVRKWSTYVNEIAAAHKRPAWAMGTVIWVKPDAKTQFKVGFDAVGPLPQELAMAVNARRAAANQLALVPYTYDVEGEDSGKY